MSSTSIDKSIHASLNVIWKEEYTMTMTIGSFQPGDIITGYSSGGTYKVTNVDSETQIRITKC